MRIQRINKRFRFFSDSRVNLVGTVSPTGFTHNVFPKMEKRFRQSRNDDSSAAVVAVFGLGASGVVVEVVVVVVVVT